MTARALIKSPTAQRSSPSSTSPGASMPQLPNQSVQVEGMRDRLPSGSTTNNNGTPRRVRPLITARRHPWKGWRLRVITTEVGRSWEWVVCGVFVRFDSARVAPQGAPDTHGLPMGAALCGALVEGADAEGRRRDRASRCRDAPGGRDQSDPCQPVSALRVRHMDGPDATCGSVRTVCGRRALSLSNARRSRSLASGAPSASCGLPVGAPSAEDEDRLLQGYQSERNVSRRVIRLSRLLVSAETGGMARRQIRRLVPAGGSR